MDKLNALKRSLAEMESVLVAYSGGVDSTFLLRVAHDVLGARAVAVTAVSASFPKSELADSKRYAVDIGATQILIDTEELEQAGYRENTPERCFFCKDELFTKLTPIAEREGLKYVVYGEIADDRSDHRPGARAAKQHQVRAPLADAGLTKLEIRRLSKELGLPTWDKPSMACLSSRIPYGIEVTADRLGMVEKAEDVLRGLGLRQYRVRHHDTVARIEVDPRDFEELVRSPLRELILAQIRAVGYQYVALDLQGYRTGSMNEVVLKANSLSSRSSS
jgi:uncharacterized protein